MFMVKRVDVLRPGKTHKASSNITNHAWVSDDSINFDGGEKNYRSGNLSPQKNLRIMAHYVRSACGQ